jgi:Tol biopolymer transport system component
MIDERELREMLERRAATISATPTDAPKAIRRARRRLVLNATVGTLVGLAVLAGAFAGLRAIQAAPTPADEPTPTPNPESLGDLAYTLDGDIFVADWDGANPVRIANGRPPSDCRDIGEYWAQGPIWSPDGRYLAYRHMDCDAPVFQTPGSWWDVVISDADGNVVTSFPSEGWGISWSPDSTRVAVWNHWGGEGRNPVWTIGVYGLKGERQTLLTLPFVISAGEPDPVWSPDGRSLLLGNFEIPLDGSRPRPLPWTDRYSGGPWRYSPDGSRVAYSNGSLVVAAADGSNAQEVFGDSPGSLVWSPAGDRIAFTSTSRGSTQLRVLDVATGTAMLLTEVHVTNESPVEARGLTRVIDFSPQGDRILFLSSHLGVAGPTSLWSVNVDGSDLRRLVTRIEWADWQSPTQAG